MDPILIIVISAVVFFQFGKRKGYTKGRNERMEINRITWYRKGINKVNDEICCMEKLDDKEILYRIKEMIRKRKNKKN